MKTKLLEVLDDYGLHNKQEYKLSIKHSEFTCGQTLHIVVQ